MEQSPEPFPPDVLKTPPTLFENILRPPSDLGVALLQRIVCPQPLSNGTQQVHEEHPLVWYSEDEPNLEPTFITQIPLPSSSACLYMADVLDEAIKAGSKSIKHPYISHIRLPLWMALVFRWSEALRDKQALWGERDQWMERVSIRCPWMAGLLGLQGGGVSSATGFGTLLSDVELTSDVLECMLDVVRADLRKNSPSAAGIASSWLGQCIMAAQGSTSAFWGKKLQSKEYNYLRLL